jgi:hypothetical protein
MSAVVITRIVIEKELKKETTHATASSRTDSSGLFPRPSVVHTRSNSQEYRKVSQ